MHWDTSANFRVTGHGTIPSARLPAGGVAAPARGDGDAEVSLVGMAVAIGGGLLISLLIYSGMTQVIGALLFILLLSFLFLIDPKLAIVATLVLLAFLGDVRRLLLRDEGSSLSPMLLVCPLAVSALVLKARSDGRLSASTPLAKLVLALMGVMVLQIFNPLQGGMAVGLAGILFYIIPLLWFWVGQAWGTPSFTELVVFRVVVLVAIAASLLGLYQAFVGLPAYQAGWAERIYGTSRISGARLRPFGPFVSTGEYTGYLLLAAIAPVGALFARNVRATVLFVPLIMAAVFFTGVRGPIIVFLAAVVALWSILSRGWGTALLRVALAAAFAVAGVTWTLGQVKDMQLSGGAASLAQHQAEGLLDPSKSSASTHTNLLASGFASALHSPLGLGLGSTNRAAGAMGGVGASSEADFTDAFIALGVPGGVLFGLIVIRTLRTAVRFCRKTRKPQTLAVTGLLLVSTGGWLKGGQYSTAALSCFAVGLIDRWAREEAAFARSSSRTVKSSGSPART